MCFQWCLLLSIPPPSSFRVLSMSQCYVYVHTEITVSGRDLVYDNYSSRFLNYFSQTTKESGKSSVLSWSCFLWLKQHRLLSVHVHILSVSVPVVSVLSGCCSLSLWMPSALSVFLHFSMSLNCFIIVWDIRQYGTIHFLENAAKAIQPCCSSKVLLKGKSSVFCFDVSPRLISSYSMSQKVSCVSHERPSHRLLCNTLSTQLSCNLKAVLIWPALPLQPL